MTPLFDLHPAGGQVVVTRFECPSMWTLACLLMVHARIKRDVRRRNPGFVGAHTVVLWRRRTLLSVTIWDELSSVYRMGDVPRHVTGARLPARLGVRTRCGVFCYAGDWRRVMFRGDVPARSPLQPIEESPCPT